MSFQSASPQKRLSSSNWFGPSSTKIIGGNRVVFGEPPFAAALRHFPVSDTLCKKAAGPIKNFRRSDYRFSKSDGTSCKTHSSECNENVRPEKTPHVFDEAARCGPASGHCKEAEESFAYRSCC